MSPSSEAYILFLFFVIVMFLLYGFFKRKLKVEEDMLSNHNLSGLSVLIQNRLCRRYSVHFAQADQGNIYNISGRVQGQNQTQYPDAYLSIEHITINNELNKPPKYDDAPPSYEEAIKLAMAQSNSFQTLEAEQAQRSQPAQSDAATTSAVTVGSAVSSRTTE